MSYELPYPLECKKCGYKGDHSRHEPTGSPVIQQPDGGLKFSCPSCWAKFVEDSVPMLTATQEQVK